MISRKSQRRRNVSTAPPERLLDEAQTASEELAERMLREAIITDPEGTDVQALAIVCTRACHPTGSHPYAYHMTLQDTFDDVAAVDVALDAIPQYVAGLELSFSDRAELCRRIMMNERPLGDAGSFIAGDYARATRTKQPKPRR